MKRSFRRVQVGESRSDSWFEKCLVVGDCALPIYAHALTGGSCAAGLLPGVADTGATREAVLTGLNAQLGWARAAVGAHAPPLAAAEKVLAAREAALQGGSTPFRERKAAEAREARDAVAALVSAAQARAAAAESALMATRERFAARG
jgi:hypothetical protein